MNNVVYAVQCTEECTDLYIAETKQPIHKCMAWHRRSKAKDWTLQFICSKNSGHSFEDDHVHILDREDWWFERRVKESIYVKLERPSLNRGGGLCHHLPPMYNDIVASLPESFRLPQTKQKKPHHDLADVHPPHLDTNTDTRLDDLGLQNLL